MLKRYPIENNYRLKKIQALQSRYNALLEYLLVGEKHMYLMHIDEINKGFYSNFFTLTGALSPQGLDTFWSEVNSILQ